MLGTNLSTIIMLKKSQKLIKNNENKNRTTMIPPESFLTIKDLCNTSCVNKKWHLGKLSCVIIPSGKSPMNPLLLE